ncbi:MAG: ABC transporter ATP-binding protein [Nanoarchaeota archaeon]
MEKETDKKIDVKYSLRLYYNLAKEYKWEFIFIIFLTLIVESMPLINSIFLKIIVDKGTNFSAGILSLTEFVNLLIIISAIYFIILVIRIFANWFRDGSLIKVEANMITNLKRKFFNHLIMLDHDFHINQKTGGLISKLIRGAGSVEKLSDLMIYNFLPMIIQVIIVSLSLIYFNLISVFIVFITMAIFILYSLFIYRLQRNANVKYNELDDREKSNISDFFTNIHSIKYFGKERRIKNLYKKISDESQEAMEDFWNYGKLASIGQILILSVGTFFILYFPMKDFLMGKITIGAITFIYGIYAQLGFYLFNFVSGTQTFNKVMADVDDLFKYNKIENNVKDKTNAKELKIEKGEIEFRNLSFSYHKRKLFENFNLKIEKNKKIALVGHSGCGKTTLIKLLYRFYDLDSGSIFIDGNNIADLKQESLRSEMSIVPQECVLFDDTIYNNIAFSNPNASREEVMKAIQFSQLDKIIEKLPKKENTIVGERGVKLSGGEKQRVSIARAILANKKILMLDEATSALDSETEFEIQKDLEKLMHGRTSIIIAHRLSTIMKADLIVVMANGRIVQEGTHEELINREGEYKKLWNLQKGGYIK